MTDTPDAKIAADLAVAATEPKALDTDAGPVTIVVPEHGRLVVVDPDRFRATPRRKRGTVKAHTPAALATLVNRHATSATVLYADVESTRIVAVLNDDDADPAGWRDHIVRLDLRHTPEWKAWDNRDGVMVSQVEFAHFLEDHVDDVVEPDGATMLELAQTFTANTDRRFHSGVRLSSGDVDLRFSEDTDAKAGKDGSLTIPEEFAIAVAPFDGSDKFKVRCRFRYRLNGGQLSIGYKMHRPDNVIREAFGDVVNDVRDNLDGDDTPIVEASPAGPVSAGPLDTSEPETF